MVWRHVSLITEENMDAVPGQFLVFFRQKGIYGARRVSAGEGNREPAALLNAGFRQTMEFLRRHTRQRRIIRNDFDFDRHIQEISFPACSCAGPTP